MIKSINCLLLLIKKYSKSKKIAPNKCKINNPIYCNAIYNSNNTYYDKYNKKNNQKNSDAILKNYIQHLESRIMNLETPIILQNNYVEPFLNNKINYNRIHKNNHIDDIIVTPYSDCDIFVSYKQNDGSDALAINMYYSLKEKNTDVWLDKMRDDERSESGMISGVKSCKVFCAIISPNYFNSNFCLLELKTAILNSKKIVVCFNGSKFKIQEALSWILYEFNYLKNNELIKLDEDNEYMKIGLEKVYKRLLHL